MNKKLLLPGFLLIGAIAAAVGFFWPFGNGKVLRLSGIVEIQEVRLGSKVGGRVAEVKVEEGELVSEGTPLVVFEVPELEATRNQLQAKLQAAQADYQKAVNGPRVEEKQAAKASADAAKARYDKMLRGWREEEKRQIASDLAAAKSDLDKAEEDLYRARESFQRKTISKAEMDAALAARERTGGLYNAAKAKYEMVLTGNRPEDIAEAKAEFERFKAISDQLEAGTRWEDILQAQAFVKEAQAKLQEVEANLAEAVVKAPEKVSIEVLAVRKGDIVAPNQPILRVLRQNDLWVKAFVPEPQLEFVSVGQDVDVVLDSGSQFKGRVTQIAKISEFTPRNIQSLDERRHQVFALKVVVPGTTVFRAGMYAEVLVPLPKATK